MNDSLFDIEVDGLTNSIQNTISGIIQGLMSVSDYGDHFYLHLVESAPFNLGKKKLYQGVPGNLFAFACKRSWDVTNHQKCTTNLHQKCTTWQIKISQCY
jgi:hypothetical protein